MVAMVFDKIVVQKGGEEEQLVVGSRRQSLIHAHPKTK